MVSEEIDKVQIPRLQLKNKEFCLKGVWMVFIDALPSGLITRICFPSMAPITCGKLARSSNSVATFASSSSVIVGKQLFLNVAQRDSHTSRTMLDIVDNPMR
ncbi:hypothetical protein QTP88_020003 [Uroleucon formosanum]